MNRSELALAGFVDRYEFNPTCRPVILNVRPMIGPRYSMYNHGLFLAIFVLLNTGCSAATHKNPVPVPGEIATMQLSEYYVAGEERGPFVIPPEHWKPILDALTPATWDPEPAPWQVLGSLEIKDKKGRSIHVSLYDLFEVSPPGAFSAGPTFEDRVYFRGGDSNRLRKALRAAYDRIEQRTD
jgi:hypothetical protein